MKSVYLRSCLALVCAILLNACGGTSGSLALSGSISGLGGKSGLEIYNKPTGEKLTILSTDTTFSFTKLLAVDEQFDVEIATQPTGAVCTASANSGAASVYTVYYVVISCVVNPYTLGGTVTGLDTKGLVLANGADIVAVLPPATAGGTASFTFPTKVGNGSPYGVTVLSQPQDTTKTCTPTNNIGTMPASDYSPVTVTCQ